MHRLLTARLALSLAGCGADVASSAATAAAARAKEAEAVQNLKRQASEPLDAAGQAAQPRLGQAEQAAQR